MRYKHKNNTSLKEYFFCLFLVIALLFIVATSNNKNVIVASNINTVKSIKSSRIVKIDKEEPNYIEVFSIEDFNNNQGNLIKFKGNIMGYGLDYQDFKCETNSKIINKIYYKDRTYGNVRILAASDIIPCGSIIKVSDHKINFIAIVLDRRIDVTDFNMKLLFESESISSYLGEYSNLEFKIMRWGY
ncbi:MAG: hypothetical protein IKN63_00530 [Bacilli bacterium]|nr:hypothetical protein [Bacilli bacterium]